MISPTQWHRDRYGVLRGYLCGQERKCNFNIRRISDSEVRVQAFDVNCCPLSEPVYQPSIADAKAWAEAYVNGIELPVPVTQRNLLEVIA